MQAMRYFLDTHDRARGSFPAQLSPEEFEVFFAQYETACQAEGVIPLRTHVGYAEGRAFCLNLAPDAESVLLTARRSTLRRHHRNHHGGAG